MTSSSKTRTFFAKPSEHGTSTRLGLGSSRPPAPRSDPISPGEIKKSGELSLPFPTQLNVPLFKIPATEKELDLIVLRKRSQVINPQPPAAEEAKKPAAVLPSPPTSPRKGRKAKRSVDADGFAPNSLWGKFFLPPHPPFSRFRAVGIAFRKEKRENSQPIPATQNSIPAENEVPEVVKKPRIPPFFISPKGDWRQLVALAKLIAPSFQSQMSGRFLKVTVADEVEHRTTSRKRPG
ncbi:hypothetical protein TNIN_240511, partial [Trichonephila inaurata madagascariensis]